MDLIGGGREPEGTGESGVHHGEGWGQRDGVGDPGALVVDRET